MRVNIISTPKICRAYVHGHKAEHRSWFIALMTAILKYQLNRFHFHK